jgi:methionyl-tRNA formyltransferase
MKIVFFGTSDVGLPILTALATEHEILEVVTSPDAPVGRKQELQATPIAMLANSLDIPLQKPERVKNNPDFITHLRSFNADIFIVVSYGKILPVELLDIPPLKTINVHFSLLPKYRGAAPIQFTLLNGDTVTGTSIFILDADVDHGPILIQKEFPIEPTDSFPTLAAKLSALSADLLMEMLPLYQSGKITPVEQDHSAATSTKLIKKESGRIDWTRSASETHNALRAFTPWPGIWTTWHGENFKILQAQPFAATETPAGKDVIPCGPQNARSYLQLLEVQPAGKKPMSMKDFLNGQPDFMPADFI